MKLLKIPPCNVSPLPIGARKIGRGGGETKDLRIFAGLKRQLGSPARAFRSCFSEINRRHVYVPLIHVEGGAAAAKQVIRGVVEIFQISKIQKSAVLPYR